MLGSVSLSSSLALLLVLCAPARAGDVWVERLGAPSVEEHPQGLLERWRDVPAPADLLRDVAHGADLSPRLDYALILWTHGESWARLELERKLEEGLALRSELQLPSGAGWLDLPLPWCARADWQESRAGCSKFEELRAGLLSAGFTFLGPADAPEEAKRWWARRGAVVLEIDAWSSGAWIAKRYGPNPLWYGPDGAPGLDFDPDPPDPVERYPGDLDRLFVDACKSPAQARARADHLLRSRGFTRLPETGWYARDRWIVRLSPAPDSPLLSCAVDLWVMPSGNDWARGLPALPGARIEPDRIVAAHSAADPASWSEPLARAGFVADGPDRLRRGGVRLTREGESRALAATIDVGPKIPGWLALEPGARWIVPPRSLYLSFPNPWGALPPRAPVEGEVALSQFDLVEPHPTDIVQIWAREDQVVRWTSPAPDNEPAPDGWGPFSFPFSGDPSDLSWRCLSERCDIDAVLLERGFVLDLAWKPAKGDPARMYRRGEGGAWVFGPAGGVIFRGVLLPWVARPDGIFASVEPVLGEPWLRTRFAAAEPLESIGPLLPHHTRPAAAGHGWAIVDDPVAPQLWWLDAEGRLLVQRLRGLGTIGAPLFEGWPGAARVSMSGSFNEMPYIELIEEREPLVSDLDSWLLGRGFSQVELSTYGALLYESDTRRVLIRFEACQSLLGAPNDLPQTCFLVAEEQR